MALLCASLSDNQIAAMFALLCVILIKTMDVCVLLLFALVR